MYRTSFLLLIITILPSLTSAAVDTFVYRGCTQPKYAAGSTYESNLNSLLTSLVNSASSSLYASFTSSLAGPPPLYGLFQCRGDLPSGDCFLCVSRAVGELGTLCSLAAGAALQLDGCFLKYDNATFLGVEDKTLVLKKCGPPTGSLSADAVLDYLSGGGAYRVSGSGEAQCVQDLGAGQCQDCLREATGRLKTECGGSGWGDMYLGKCYVRFNVGGARSSSSDGKKANFLYWAAAAAAARLGFSAFVGNNDDDHNDEEIKKTLAILIGLIAGVALLIVFLSFLRKVCEKAGNGTGEGHYRGRSTVKSYQQRLLMESSLAVHTPRVILRLRRIN